jgi:hypothetical protein
MQVVAKRASCLRKRIVIALLVWCVSGGVLAQYAIVKTSAPTRSLLCGKDLAQSLARSNHGATCDHLFSQGQYPPLLSQ